MELAALLGELVPYAGLATGIVITAIVYRMVTRSAARRPRDQADQLMAKVNRLGAVVDTLHEVSERVHEFAERQEVTERVLARARTPEGLARGG